MGQVPHISTKQVYYLLLLFPLFTYLKLVNLLEVIDFSPLQGPQVMHSEQLNILAPNYGMLCHFRYVLKDFFQYFDLNLKLSIFTPMSSLSISPSLTSTLIYLFPHLASPVILSSHVVFTLFVCLFLFSLLIFFLFFHLSSGGILSRLAYLLRELLLNQSMLHIYE